MKNSEQPAFACTAIHENNSHLQEGLIKREYFAGLAMQGLLANSEWMKVFEGEKYLMQSDIIAETSVVIADILLHQLESKKGGGE